MKSCLEIIYFISTSQLEKVITSNEEVLHCLLMVSTEKHRNKTQKIQGRGNVVIANVFFVFSFYLGQMTFIQIDLGIRSQDKNECWTWGTQKDEAGS